MFRKQAHTPDLYTPLGEDLGYGASRWCNGGWGLHTFCKCCEPSADFVMMFSFAEGIAKHYEISVNY